MKKKKCKVCGTEFVPVRSTAIACSYGCATKWVAARNQKLKEKQAKLDAQLERKFVRERKEALKTRRDYINEAQTAFNAYIRERDKNQLCICCGKPLTLEAVGGGYDCGHYRSTGSAPHLRFNEDNAHGQRKVCNRYGAGRAVDYRLGLIKRIGIKRVESIEADNSPAKWDIDELKAIRDYYKQKLKELRKGVQ